MRRTLSVIVSLLAATACAEVRRTDAGTDAPLGADTPLGGTDAPARDVPAASDAGAGALVINEVNAEAPDWVELLNAGTTDVSLEGLSIVDGDDTHAPVAFPAGASLTPGERYVVAFDTLCATAAPDGLGLTANCVETTYGLGGTGDTIRVLRGTAVTDPVEVELVFPGGLGVGETYCRLPDGSGDFGSCAPTLNAVNAAP